MDSGHQKVTSQLGPATGNGNDDGDGELCAFCLDQLNNPVKLRCSHSFCRGCLQVYREARSWVAERCPLCRRLLEEHVAPNWMATCSLVVLMLLLLILPSMGTFYLLLIYW